MSLTLTDVCAVIPPQQEFVWAGHLARDLSKRFQRTITYKRVNELLAIYELKTVDRLMKSPTDGVERTYPHYEAKAIIAAEEKDSAQRAQARLQKEEERKRPGRPATGNVTLQLRIPEELYGKLIIASRERGETSNALAVHIISTFFVDLVPVPR